MENVPHLGKPQKKGSISASKHLGEKLSTISSPKWGHFPISEGTTKKLRGNTMHRENPAHAFFRELLARRGSLRPQPAFASTEERHADDTTQAAISTLQDSARTVDHVRVQTRRRINGALERWQTGQYGKCVECDGAIHLERLAAIPETELCLRCQQLAEKRTRNFRYASW
jgi:DnaK suppressor protein